MNDTVHDTALRTEIGDDGIALIRLDLPGESHNIIRLPLIEALEASFGELAARSGLRGVILLSDKPGSFIAGADVRMLADCKSRSEASSLARRGQAFCNRVANFPVPVVAVIDGVCLGGGLEFALACQGRIASDESATRLGLPEVKLGLLPGSGGTQRLPALIGIARALDLMLTGRQISSRQARAIGLIDEVVPAGALLTAARRRVEALRHDPDATAKPSLIRRLLENNLLGRQVIINRARKQVRIKGQGNYPALSAIVDCIEYGARKTFAVSLEYEAERFGELSQTRQARALMRLYFATTAVKKPVDEAAPRPVDALAVLGAGLMGAGIAMISSRAGFRVRLKDTGSESLLRGLRHVDEQVERAVRRRRISPFEAGQQRRRVTPTTDYRGLRGYPLVIEAVFEDLALKQRLLHDVEQHGDAHSIFASNTSALPIASIAANAARPQNVIGMHYFSPVEKMPLLEVVVTEHTDPAVIATAVAVGRRQGKTVIVVRDGAGFYLNRILAPYINEAGRLLLEGVPIETIDTALVKFGFPMGPLALLDTVGFEVAAKVGEVLHEAFGERLEPAPVLARLIETGRQGRKNRKGFYRYDRRSLWRGKRTVDSSVYDDLGIRCGAVVAADDIVERCVLPMLNEAVRCRTEGIIRSERDGDIGAVFGIGFPPFRGGPFYYLDQLGRDIAHRHLTRLAQRHGPRFAPAPSLRERGG